jgi:plasmid stabilization system protein ParE
MAKKYKAKYLDSAQKDIADAVSYIAVTLVNPTAADTLIDEIEKKVELLCSGYWRGQQLKNHSSGWFDDMDMNWCKVKNYYLFFRLDDEKAVLRIYHFSHRLRGLDRILDEAE